MNMGNQFGNMIDQSQTDYLNDMPLLYYNHANYLKGV